MINKETVKVKEYKVVILVKKVNAPSYLYKYFKCSKVWFGILARLDIFNENSR